MLGKIRFVALADVEPNGQGVGQHFAGHPVSQMPCVTRPDFREAEALLELGDDGLDAPAQPQEQLEPPAGAALLHALAQGRPQVDAQGATFVLKPGAEVALVAQQQPLDLPRQVVGRFPLVHAGGRDRHAHRPAPQADQQMTLQAEEVFVLGRAVAEIGLALEHAAAGRAGQPAYRHRKAVDDVALRLPRPKLRQPPPVQELLHAPQVRRLPHEPAAIPKPRKPSRPVALEILEDRLVPVLAEKLAHDLQCDHLAVAQARGEAPAAQPRTAHRILEVVIHPAENHDDKLFN